MKKPISAKTALSWSLEKLTEETKEDMDRIYEQIEKAAKEGKFDTTYYLKEDDSKLPIYNRCLIICKLLTNQGYRYSIFSEPGEINISWHDA